MTNKDTALELVKKYGLGQEDYYFLMDNMGVEKMIIKRTGIDKVHSQVGMIWQPVNVWVTPYGNKISVVLLGKGFLAGDAGIPTFTLVSVNPDNCQFPNYAEVAEKRCRHRLLLMLTGFYENNVFSEDESADFKQLNVKEEMKEVVEGIGEKLNDIDKLADMFKSVSESQKKKASESKKGKGGKGTVSADLETAQS